MRFDWGRDLIVLAIVAATAIGSPAQTFETLADFDGTNGQGPYIGSLAQGADNNLYGTTLLGGVTGDGTIFKIMPDCCGGLTMVHSFDVTDGSSPAGGLILATDGNLYGTTEIGGINDVGSIFKIDPSDGSLTTLHSFDGTDGTDPVGTLIQATDGNFYGTAVAGGLYGHGTVFKVTSQGALTTLHDFNVIDGSTPVAGLVQAVDGNLYGTTASGGTGSDCVPNGGCGTVFRISLGGSLTTLHSFDGVDGESPYGTFIQATDANLYGTTVGGGLFGYGTIFRMTLKGKLTTIHSFRGADGSAPEGRLIQSAGDGNIYGTTYYGGDPNCNQPLGCGTVFEVENGGRLTTLHVFESSDGMGPYAGLLQDTNGTFYGTTYLGGTENNGTVFSLSMGFGLFITFVRDAGKIGQTGGILGQGFTGITCCVMLNGISANFTVVSDTYLTATVPAGATTGFVTVTTHFGKLKSNVPFHVIQ
jgi:uncharacterized repeat protein (TIGR03803 family)